ncbi:MAG: type I restriction endonuclease subunit R [bacterium]
MVQHHPDSEDALEKATIERFVSMGYSTANLYNETFGKNASHGRETSSEVFFTSRLEPALKKLNDNLPSEAIRSGIADLTRDRSAMNPVYANQEIHNLLKNGTPVTWKNKAGEECSDRVRFIDWDNPANNDFFLAQQMWVTGEIYKKRCDLVACVNGIPLVFIELKKPAVNIRHAFDDNLKDYKTNTIPQLWWYNAFIILSNGIESRMGSMTGEWGHFAEWKKISDEKEKGVISLDTMIQGTCDPSRLIDIMENFILFSEVKGGLAKVVAKNHQFLGVRNAVEAVKKIRKNKGKLGVFWHTQGSGKSYSMAFFCQYVMRRVPGNWTFVIVTDRQELDGQIYKTFTGTGLVAEKQCQADSVEHLKQLLTEDHRFVFTLIQKFQTRDGSLYPKLSDRSDVIVITDEAHRSQYDTLAMNMRRALPNAAFIGFTGTPLIAGEEKTRQVFGDYVSVYNFKQSVDDGATVPLYYENRIPELQLTNAQLNEDMAALLESAELDAEQEKKLERTFAKEYHLITRDERLETIAKDLVEHFMGRGMMGKAMVVCIDRYTAVRMYDKVRKYWQKYYDNLRKRAEKDDSLIEQANFMKGTDMAVIISSSQNEQADFQSKGLDILTHRKRMAKEDLENDFKDGKDPLRIVFVCAMWITGFDVPSCSTIYLDKPMRNHTLMQTIARANRVFPEKNNGLIVDYVGIFRNLQKALAIYGTDSGGGIKGGETPVQSKEELVAMLKAVIADTGKYCGEHGVDIPAIVAQEKAFERTALIESAVEKLIYPDDVKKEFIRQADLVVRVHKAVMPDPAAHEYDGVRAVVTAIANNLRTPPEDVDISEIMKAVEELLDRSIAAKGYVIQAGKEQAQEKKGKEHEYRPALVDLSKIDFKALKRLASQGQLRTVVDKLRAAIQAKLDRMVQLNRMRMDYMTKFEQMIVEYNAGSRNIEHFFKELTAFVKDLDEEEKRGVREGLSDEELALFDILTKPEIKLTEKERKQVKEVAQELLQRLKTQKLVLDWRKRQQSRANVRLTIETTLEGLPRTYTKPLFAQKCDSVYQHVFDSYFDGQHSVYAEAG